MPYCIYHENHQFQFQRWKPVQIRACTATIWITSLSESLVGDDRIEKLYWGSLVPSELSILRSLEILPTAECEQNPTRGHSKH